MGTNLDALKERFQALSEALPPFILRLKRAMQGQTLEEDVYSGLLNVKDIRERTRLREHDVYGHSMMQLLAGKYEEMAIWKDIAQMEDAYFISQDGEQRKEAILMARAKSQIGMFQMGQPLALPEMQGTEKEKEGKKGLFGRSKEG